MEAELSSRSSWNIAKQAESHAMIGEIREGSSLVGSYPAPGLGGSAKCSALQDRPFET
jgi:hypothetical protein